MVADLAKANANRAAVPWLIAIAHKAWNMDTTYCPPGGGPCTANGTWFDEPLQAAGVDLMYVGHMHEYRRYTPAYGTRGLLDVASMSGPGNSVVTDPKYTTTIVTGATGCQEVQPASCGGPSPADPANPTAACSRNYGYGEAREIDERLLELRPRSADRVAAAPEPLRRSLAPLRLRRLPADFQCEHGDVAVANKSTPRGLTRTGLRGRRHFCRSQPRAAGAVTIGAGCRVE